MTTALSQRGPSKAAQVNALMEKMGPEIARGLPKHVTPDRMTRIVQTALRQPELAACTEFSLCACIVGAAQLGLEVNTPLGHAYLAPFRNKKTSQKESQLIIGYRGFIDLAYRSGQVTYINAEPVYSNDTFNYALGSDPHITHRPADGERGQLTHVYAVAKLRHGGATPLFKVLTKADVEALRKRSKASESGPWNTDYVAMACKTAVRQLWKFLPLSPEDMRVLEVDTRADMGLRPITGIAALDGPGTDEADIVVDGLEERLSGAKEEANDNQPAEGAPAGD